MIQPLDRALRTSGRVFTGDAAELSEVRRFIESVLGDYSIREDVIACAVELSGNAVLHSSSGNGGTFTVELSFSQTMLRLAVTDEGGDVAPVIRGGNDGDLPEGGRGLAIVSALSARTGIEGDHTGRVVWAEFLPNHAEHWMGPDPRSRTSSSSPRHHMSPLPLLHNDSAP